MADPRFILAYASVEHVLAKARTLARTKGAVEQRAGGNLAVFAFPKGGWRTYLDALATATMTAERQDLRFAVIGDPAEDGLALAMRAFAAESAEVWLAKQAHGWVAAALADRHVFAHFQPIVDVVEGTVFAHEALLRAHAPDGSLAAAGTLLQEAERIDQLFLLDQLGRDAAIRCAHAQGLTNTPIFINFLPQVIYDPARCLETTMQAIKDTGFRPENIVFEVVESGHAERTDLLRVIDHYRARGFKIALDDLGAGYASLNLLSALRPDYVKLDIELVREASADPLRGGLVEAISSLAERFDIGVIAEGVENDATARFLRDTGIRLMQGYHFGRPAATPTVDGAALDALDGAAAARPRRTILPPDLPKGLEGLTAEQANALPYGLIELAPDGTILAYNLAESRLSGLDPARVIGKNFFRDLAPCTAVQEFEGRFHEGVERGELNDTFDFIFAFKPPKRVLVQLFVTRAPKLRCWVGVAEA